MSDAVKDFKEKFPAIAELEKKKQEVQKRELIIRDKKSALQLERMEKTEEEIKKAKEVSYTQITEEELNAILKDNDEYIEAAKRPVPFICDAFNGIVPFFRKNLIVIGGKTGEGKSTAVANIIFGAIEVKDPETGRYRRILVITNEEKVPDVYNRVTCLQIGIPYTNHDKFTDKQKAILQKGIEFLIKSGRLHVIDDTYKGIPGTTTSLEGIKGIFDGLMKDYLETGFYYDAVILDYYQNVKSSKKFGELNQYQIQEMLSTELDLFKNIYPAPIVVLAQVKPPDAQDTPFNQRIKGSKSLPDRATMVLEMVAEREDFRTAWTTHKSRFTESMLGKPFHTGFKNGRFVKYDTEFKKAVSDYKEKRQMQAVYAKESKENGLSAVFKKDENNGNNSEGTGSTKT